MITISVKHEFDKFARTLDRQHRDQLPFATAMALTDTARAAQRQVTADLPGIFDRPTPFTMRALTIIPARKERQFAVVMLRDTQARYLLPEEIGGQRTPATNTRQPARALVEPGPRLRRDQFGGIPSGAVRRLMRQMRAATGRAAQARSSGKQSATRSAHGAASHDRGMFYVGPHGHGHLTSGGIYQRLPGHRLTHLIAFVPAAHYQPRFHFAERVDAACRIAFLPAMQQRYAEAVETAR